MAPCESGVLRYGNVQIVKAVFWRARSAASHRKGHQPEIWTPLHVCCRCFPLRAKRAKPDLHGNLWGVAPE